MDGWDIKIHQNEGKNSAGFLTLLLWCFSLICDIIEKPRTCGIMQVQPLAGDADEKRIGMERKSRTPAVSGFPFSPWADLAGQYPGIRPKMMTDERQICADKATFASFNRFFATGGRSVVVR